MKIRTGEPEDFDSILAVVNDAAQAYRGVIPHGQWHDPYMTTEELRCEVSGGIAFWLAEDEGRLVGVIGLQDKGDVVLVRHAYVSTTVQRRGVGTRLLKQLTGLVEKPVLVGTWADAPWALDFYRRNGFTVLSKPEAAWLLSKYWSIPPRQAETSAVLGDQRWITSPVRALAR